MASKTLGRIACPIHCGFESAHVKIKTDKGEGKAAFPYVHCPSCGVQLHTKSEEQAQHLLRHTRAEKLAPAPDAEPKQAPAEIVPAPTTTPAPAPAPAAKPAGLFGLFQ